MAPERIAPRAHWLYRTAYWVFVALAVVVSLLSLA
jgi:hypothetical protein